MASATVTEILARPQFQLEIGKMLYNKPTSTSQSSFGTTSSATTTARFLVPNKSPRRLVLNTTSDRVFPTVLGSSGNSLLSA
jgi:hypothetical protein